MALYSHYTRCLQTNISPLSGTGSFAKAVPLLPAIAPAPSAQYPLPLPVFMHGYFFLSLFSRLTSSLCQKNSLLLVKSETAHFLAGAHQGQGRV